MSPARRSETQLVADAVDALLVALRAADLAVVGAHDAGPADTLVDILVDDRPFTLAVEVKAYCTGATARELLDRGPTPPGQFPVLVADKITTDARAQLTDAGWSWLDRRGRLHLRATAVRVDIDVPTAEGVETGPLEAPISGRSGIAIAYWLLEHRHESLSPNGHASELGFAPSTISTTVRRLAAVGLVDDDRRALVPELFWELAAIWRVERTWLATEPDPQQHTAPETFAPGWRQGGTAAAAAWGGPVVTGEGGPVELYVPGPVEVSIAVRRYGVAGTNGGRAALTVAPTMAVCAGTGDDYRPRLANGWLAAPKLAITLDLARDKARGREILADWTDADAVWR